MTDSSIRQSRPGDGAGCAALWRETGAFMAALNPRTFQVPSADGLAAWFEEINAVYRHDQDKLLLVAEADGVLVGSVTASLHEPLDTAQRQLQSDLPAGDCISTASASSRRIDAAASEPG